MFKKLLNNVLLSCGRYATRCTDPESVRSLIRSLAPQNVGIDLVRLGPNADGGYLVPDDLENINVCFSPGVDDQSGFDDACCERGMSVFLADASVEGPVSRHIHRLNFTKKFIGSNHNDQTMTLESWVLDNSTGDNQLLLQMDIEGAEYEVLICTPRELLSQFRIIVVEFHDLTELWNSQFFKFASIAFSKLLNDFTCVHIHPNNLAGITVAKGIDIPRVMEFTFLRNDRVLSLTPVNSLPHPLDKPNVPGSDIKLSNLWLQGRARS